MALQYFTLLFSTWLTSQTIKYLIQLQITQNKSLGLIAHTYLFASGPPSTHTAILTSSLLFIHHYYGINNPIFFVSTMFTSFWLFEIYMQRKRANHTSNVFDRLFKKPSDLEKLLDLHGHSLRDMTLGLLVGSLVYLGYNLL